MSESVTLGDFIRFIDGYLSADEFDDDAPILVEGGDGTPFEPELDARTMVVPVPQTGVTPEGDKCLVLVPGGWIR